MKNLLAVLATFILAAQALGENTKLPTSIFYPFKVTIDKQTGGVKTKNDLFATFPQAIRKDATLTIEKESPSLIINAFPVKEDGSYDQQKAVVYFLQHTHAAALSKPLQGALVPGTTYLANIVAHGKTSRITFVMADEKTTRLPGLSHLIDFLKK